MKFGVIMHTETANLGDDIQSYAILKQIPSMDYIIDREHIDTFKTDNNEPVAVVMAGWWFWQKWNWPPSKCIVPLNISMHINNYNIYRRGTPVKDRWLDGLGGDYLRKYGPVGVRDTVSLQFFKDRNIDAYFSGCITLTLPKQKKTEDAGEYIVIADLNEKLKKKAYELLKDTGLRIVEVTHNIKYRNSDATIAERFDKVEEVLTLYQNARCVITRRLHVTLPCLAMEVPVISIVDLNDEGNSTRWSPYSDWAYYVSNEDFFNGNFEYDFLNPPANKDNYKETRENLIKTISNFVNECNSCNKSIDELDKTGTTNQEIMEWQHHLMKQYLEDWLHDNRGLLKRYNDSKAETKKLEKKILKLEEKTRKLEKKLKFTPFYFIDKLKTIAKSFLRKKNTNIS